MFSHFRYACGYTEGIYLRSQNQMCHTLFEGRNDCVARAQKGVEYIYISVRGVGVCL